MDTVKLSMDFILNSSLFAYGSAGDQAQGVGSARQVSYHDFIPFI